MKKVIILLLLVLPLMVTAQRVKRTPNATDTPQPRNVIFIVGDGMGTAQVYSSIVSQGTGGSAFLRFPYSGFSRTYSYNRYTTDSGAGGSALMTGHKVENRHIAKGPDGTDYNSFLVDAKRFFGKAAGFVVTCSVLDATPASTYAHVTDRKLFDSISLQMAQCPCHDGCPECFTKQGEFRRRMNTADDTPLHIQRIHIGSRNLNGIASVSCHVRSPPGFLHLSRGFSAICTFPYT